MNSPIILNVDDHEAGRYARGRLLSRAGYIVHDASSGLEALSKVESLRPALVLLDVNMPDMSGLEVCRRIKTDLAVLRIAVLQLSASAITAADRVGGLDNGADGYLIEPVDPEVLLATVRALLRIRKAETELEAANTALAQANIKLTELNLSLTRSNEDLQRFAHLASHDLQEPLKTMSSYATLVQRRYKGRLDDQADEFLTHIQNGAMRMGDLIKGLLGYAEAGQQSEHDWAPVSAEEVVALALNNLEQSIAESKAIVTYGALPAIRGDGMQLTQLFQNVVSNGIKYRLPDEPPRITISAKEDAGHGIVFFSVTDNGIGIAPAHHKQIFAPFRRLHGQEVPGSGIGLATCQRIVEGHGGKIWVESAGQGLGSTFWFSLPAA
ncbi:MAG TPA: ATP-binding protein [Bryobacteraceae bacterium]|nr:ATP-binding protein [Bryobacteraceae bacterium]